MRFRLIPLVFSVIALALVLKIADIVVGKNQLSEQFLVGTLKAADGEDDTGEGEEGESGEEEEIFLNPKDYEGPTVVQPSDVSQMEKEILENLAKRREELEEWNRSIALRENVLNATEQKINAKIEELKKLKSEVSSLLSDYDEKENAKIKSLVKIYESMKPKDAARIFERIEMPILLKVVDKMKEAKAAPILAKMSPKKAQILTIELAKQRQLNIK